MSEHSRYPVKRRCELRQILFDGYKRRWWAEFYEQHPKACRTCHATGLVWHLDYWDGWIDYDCSDCKTNNCCPRCGKKSLIKSQWGYAEKCRYTYACGWHPEWEDMPTQPYCICSDDWYATERRLKAEQREREALELLEVGL